MEKMTITFETYDDDGEEVTLELPGKYEVCSRCEGHGKHVNPNIDGNGITADEWENDWDEESRESYMNGLYDVTCESCNGARVELVLDEEACDKKIVERYYDDRRRQARYDHEDAMIRRMESGGYY